MPHEHSPEQGAHTAQITQRNDAFRRSTQEVMITSGVQALPDVLGLIHAVRVFDRFTPENDPRGEHDYSSIAWYGDKALWKIDYFDPQLRYWCDPLSEECRRVLTVVLASEY